MRSVQLFLCLVASACVASKYIKDVRCTKDGGCEWSPNSQKDTPKLWDDAIANALTTVSQYMNMTGPFEFSNGNHGNTTLTQETTYGELVGNKMTMEMKTELTYKGSNGGEEYESTMTVAIHQESYLEDLVISWHQVGEGQIEFLLPQSNYSVTGNVSILGSGSMSTHSTGTTKMMEEMTRIVEMHGHSSKTIVFDNYNLEAEEEQVILTGYSVTTSEVVVSPEAADTLLPNPLKKVLEILFPRLDSSPTTTYISELKGELPPNGVEGPIEILSTGVMHADDGEYVAFEGKTAGHILYVAEDTNNAIGKGYLPQLPMINLPLFH